MAVMVFAPVARADALTLSAAAPLLTGTLPSIVLPRENTTVPVAVAGLRAAVSVLVPLAGINAGDGVSVRVVADAGAVTVRATVPEDPSKEEVAV